MEARVAQLALKAERVMSSTDFVDRHSIVRTIWADPDLVLLIFAGSAAEFALNRAVDWLFFTGNIPNDPLGRLFSTVRYAQEIVFSDEALARTTLDRITAVHSAVEKQRGQTIPDWAYRDVLYMLIDYSERAHRLLYRPLTVAERHDLYAVFRRVGAGLRIKELPESYREWQEDRLRHLNRDLAYSDYTRLLFKQYRQHLGPFRYEALLQVQAALAPGRVRELLQLRPLDALSFLIGLYGVIGQLGIQSIIHRVLIPPGYWDEFQKLDRSSSG
ncbi:MAG TPA: oxygenase MpaB family protein [Blastocatellia bacterium]|nr:oxygenase MpaB family protein [Blastocatellia bacterium]